MGDEYGRIYVLDTEAERVEAIMDYYKKDPKILEKAFNELDDYKSSKEGKRIKELYDMNKVDQVNLLLKLGLTPSHIRELKLEKWRVDEIYKIEMINKVRMDAKKQKENK